MTKKPNVLGGLAVGKNDRRRGWWVTAEPGIASPGIAAGPFLRRYEAVAYRRLVLDRVGGDLDAVRDPETGALTDDVSGEDRAWLRHLNRVLSLVDYRRSRYVPACIQCGGRGDHEGPCERQDGETFIPDKFLTWAKGRSKR